MFRPRRLALATPLFLLATTVPSIADPAVDLNAVRGPELLWRSPSGLVPLPRVETTIDLDVRAILVHGRVHERFRNPTGETIEVVYAFPLPDRAAIHNLELAVGERRIVGEIQEREHAIRTYEAARSTGRKAALLAQKRPNLFTIAVANVNPDETIDVSLEYHEQLVYRGGRFELRFPLVFLPRYAPPAGSGEAPERTTGREERAAHARASVTVALRPGFPIRGIDSPSHAVRVDGDGDALVVTPEDGAPIGDRDFVLVWTPILGPSALVASAVERRGEERYALSFVLPPSLDSDAGVGLPTQTVFVIDVSGSMDGPSIVQARAALLAALDRLRPEDRFAIVAFSDTTSWFEDRLESAEPATVAAARDWVRGLGASGGTRMAPALSQAIDRFAESRARHGKRIVFLTDGAVSNEEQLLTGLVERLGEIRLHAIGIGAAPNSWLLRKLAESGGGLHEFVSSDRDGERIAGFFERLDRPVLEDVRVSFDRGNAESFPERIPDLHADEPLVLWSRLDDSSPARSLELRGFGRSGPWSTVVELAEPAETGAGVAQAWARAKVESRLDAVHDGASPEEVRREVLDLGLAYAIVTPETSFVAVEQMVTGLSDPSTVRLAALPSGGTDRPARRAAGLLLLGLSVALFFLGGRRIP